MSALEQIFFCLPKKTIGFSELQYSFIDISPYIQVFCFVYIVELVRKYIYNERN